MNFTLGIEAVLTLVTAVALVLKFGLVGVTAGTLVAMVYRTCYLAWYIKALCPIQKLHATTYFGWSIYKETVTNFNQKRQVY